MTARLRDLPSVDALGALGAPHPLAVVAARATLDERRAAGGGRRGRRVSVIDVPGHERLVRTMVAGATGIDVFLMVVAADDGVMPQTREHAAVLTALGVTRGVVAITKSDLADPDRAAAEAAELLPGAAVIPVAAPTGQGLEELRAALDAAVAGAGSRAAAPGPLRLHVDRAFTVRGAGTVVTGTLWSGVAARGASVELLPDRRRARVRGVQVHDEPVERAAAGQRVALNLAGLDRDEVRRGDVVVAGEDPPAPSYRIDVALDWIAAAAEPKPAPAPAPEAAELTASAQALEARLPDAGHEPPPDAELGAAPEDVQALLAAGRIHRLGRTTHIHRDALAAVERVVVAAVERDEEVTIAGLRDELGTSRKYAQALLEQLDAERVTLRVGDRRVLRRRR